PAAILFNKPQKQVKAIGCAAARKNSILFGDNSIGPEYHIGKRRCKSILGIDVCCRGFIVEQSRGSKQESSGTKTCDGRAILILATKPRNPLEIYLQRGGQCIMLESRNQDDIVLRRSWNF